VKESPVKKDLQERIAKNALNHMASKENCLAESELQSKTQKVSMAHHYYMQKQLLTQSNMLNTSPVKTPHR
jgi:hypothetical protein